MRPFFLLCDPALLLPPETDDEERGLYFWQRLITWSADHRVRVGPMTLDLVHASFADMGWPRYEPPACPTALARTARRSLNTLLARTQIPSDAHPSVSVVPALTPSHRSGELVEEAVSSDAAGLCSDDLLGLATDRDHWVPPGDFVVFNPPPPEALTLISEPSQLSDQEIDRAVAVSLRERRITIVGGWPKPELIDSLCVRFELEATQVRWLSSEHGKRLNLDPLATLQASMDVVVCITGHIGHPGRDGVRSRCRKWGIEPRCIEDRNQIAESLRQLYGAS